MVCRYFSRIGVLCACLLLVGSCVTVRPTEREFLADPSMTFGAGGKAKAHDQHVFNNREGSFGGEGMTGGGCGCN